MRQEPAPSGVSFALARTAPDRITCSPTRSSGTKSARIALLSTRHSCVECRRAGDRRHARGSGTGELGMLAYLRKRRTILPTALIVAVVWSTCVSAGVPCCGSNCALACAVEPGCVAPVGTHRSAGGCCSNSQTSKPLTCECQAGCPCCDPADGSDRTPAGGWSERTFASDLAALPCTCAPARGSLPQAPVDSRHDRMVEGTAAVAAAVLVSVVVPPVDEVLGLGPWDGASIVALQPPVRIRCCVWTI